MSQHKKMKKISTYFGGISKSIHQIILCLMFVSVALQSSAQIDVKLDFSQERGFNDVAFDLVITSTEAGATIRYTLDGEEPTLTSGTIYNGSLTIDTTTVLRAIGYISGIDTSKVYTHTYLFLDNVLQQPANIDGWPNNTYDIGSGSATAVHDYEMDPAIVDSPDYSADLIQGLKDIPTMSIVMPKDDFWDMYDGTSEKKTSIELLYANDPAKNEQEDGGIEPHSHDRLKRSMRLSFKSIYGTANWDSDIFRNAAVGSETAENEFDRIVLRAGNNRAWSRNWNTDRTAFTRDEWFRQSQIASSGIGSHGTFVHLYVNGLYWGLYNPVERPDEAFTSTYLGGEKEDWFAVSHGGDQGGDDTRYDYMMNNLLNTNLTQSANYDELQEYLDIDKFSDYLLVSWMTGVQDWPNNNWWGGNRNNPAGPFMYFGWDNEWSWDVTNNANNGAWVHPQFEANDNGGNASAFVFNKSKVNEDFKMAFADRAYKLCYNNGAMTDDNSRLRWSTLNNNIANAVVAESARWGDGIDDGTTRTRDVHWQDEVDRLDGLMDGNVDRLITALRDEDYYPSIDPPLFENNNDTIAVQELAVTAGYAIDLINPNSNGDIYYTTNGVDPRMSGGGIDPSATIYTNQVIINTSTTLLGRVKVGNEWSALHCLNVIVNADLNWIKLTEIMYNPGDLGLIPSGELEFLEIKNTHTSLSADISGLQITDGVDFTFPVGTTMAPQSFLVIASNAAELSAKCPGVNIFGEYGGALSNGGENIDFVTFVGDTIIRVEYNDVSPWPIEADGGGYSLVPTETNPIGSQDDVALWKLSDDNVCGSPGVDDVCADSDNDGVCDLDDQCPGFDDTLIYTSCDDGDASTVNDVYTTACICEGIPVENSDLSWIKLTEIMYNPADFGLVDGGDLEFLEIKNTSTTLTLNIGGLQITDGVDFIFPFGTTMAPQSFLVIASNAAELSAKCPGVIIFGEYEGGLSNGGELIEFVSAGASDTLIRVEYDDINPWPIEADGGGYSLVPTETNPVGSQDDFSLWRLSTDNFCGSPGADEQDCVDTDNDTVCDVEDQCPNFDDLLIGTFCDDGDATTVNDVYTTNCICQGIPVANSDLSWLKLTEIMYNPGDYGLIGSGDLEFLEIKNTSTSLTLDISLLQITEGVEFTFPFGTTMGPQSFLVIANNAAELSAKCPGVTIFGEYGGSLSNGGELIEFVSLASDTLISVEYDDVLPWPIEADGGGYSLVPTDPNPIGSQDSSFLWKLSIDNFCASPGADEFDCEGILDINLVAITDMGSIDVAGFVPAYIDNVRGALAIDASQYQDVFAAATVIYTGVNGTYDLELFTMAESDGESTYKISINGTALSETFTNPVIFGTTIPEYAQFSNVWENISLTNGDEIRVEFNSASNGFIPEGDGFAFSRGRWTELTIVCSGVIDNDDDNDGVINDEDVCPDFDDNLIGTTCDDGNPCTINDVYTSTCECIGTIEEANDEVITLNAIDDAYLQGSTRFNTNILRIEANNRVSYLKFNIPTQSGTLVTADLELQVSNDAGSGEILAFLGSSSTWTETNLSTSNSPSEVTQIGSLNTTYSIGQSYTWSLDIAQITSGDMSIILRQTGGNDVSFHSDEATSTSVRPILTLTYSNSGSSSNNGAACDDGDPCTVNDIVDENCNCAGTFADADGDGICDADDNCDGSLVGTTCDDNDPNTSNDVYDANCVCSGTAAVSTSPLLESEDATVGSNWTIESDTEACSSEYALPPNTTQYNEAPSLPEDHITFTFNVDVAGTYKVYARTMTTSGDDDSFWVRANGGTWNPWNKINFGNYGNFYQWSQVGNWTSGDNATPVTFELVAGTNTVDFAWREPGARLDKIFVTNEDLSVLNLVRNNDSSGDLSFKYTVEEACPNDTIRFEPITDGTTIIVDNNMISIDRTLTIIGNGTTQTVLSGDDLYQIFTNTSSNILSIHNLKMMNGFAPTDGGAFINNGVILLKDVELEGNMEGTTPKAFSNTGTVTISENGNVTIKE